MTCTALLQNGKFQEILDYAAKNPDYFRRCDFAWMKSYQAAALVKLNKYAQGEAPFREAFKQVDDKPT